MTDKNLVEAARRVVDLVLPPEGKISRYHQDDLIVAALRIRDALPVELKPCPAGHSMVHTDISDFGAHRINCTSPGCNWSMGVYVNQSKADIIKAWNTRAGEGE